MAQGQEALKDQNQVQFEAGVRAMFSGRQVEAVSIFENLHKKTGATRVKLEWARAAFLGKKYDLSKRLFDEVLTEPIPDIVRFNIALYLEKLAQLGDLTDYGVSFTSDTNPFTLAKPQQIIIYGLPFSYSPPKAKETLSGLTFFVSHSHSLTEDGTVRLIAEADDTQYKGKDNNKSSVKLALQLKHKPDDNLSLRFGVDHFFQRQTILLRQPYLGVQYRKDQLAGFFNHYQIDFKTGENIYPNFSYVDGNISSMATGATKNIGNNLQVGGNLFLDKATSKTESQAYRTIAGSVYARFFTPSISSNMRINYTSSKRSYKAMDELFIVKREDQRKFFSVSIQPYRMKIFNLYPALEFGLEKSDSNISINSFARTFFNFMLRRNY